jgi:hypothetical protein
LIRVSWDRFQAARDEPDWFFEDYNNMDAAVEMSLGLANIRDERGLREGAVLLEFLDAFDPAARERVFEGESRWANWKSKILDDLVPFLHKYLPPTTRYVPLAVPTERRKQVAAIREYFEAYRFP